MVYPGAARSNAGSVLQLQAGAAADSGSTAGSDRSRQQVLVIEDDPHDREIYGLILGYNGFDVVFAASAADGLRLARECAPDLVVLDFGLPDLHGIELCRTLRRETTLEATPIVALTAFAEKRFGESARSAGCTCYMEKPARPLDVLHEVERLIGKAPLPGDGRPPSITPPPH